MFDFAKEYLTGKESMNNGRSNIDYITNKTGGITMETMRENTKIDDNGQVRVVASTEMMDRLEVIANRMSDLYARMSGQLAPICNPVLSSAPSDAKNGRKYPEFFEKLRDRMVSIENSIDLIHDILNSCEI